MSMEEPKKPEEAAEEQMESEEQTEEVSEYSFLQETIKDDTVSKEKVKKNIFKMVGFGLIFGIAASLGFCVSKPWLEPMFQSDPEKVTIPDEEGKDVEEEPQDTQDNVSQVLTVDSYRQMNQALSVVAQEAGKSVVEVTGMSGEQDWLASAYDSQNGVAGLIVADNGQQLLILGKTTILKDSSEMRVTFADGKVYPATLNKKDGNFGFAIYGVDRAAIADSTWAQIAVASLGSSNSVSDGAAAIVLGNQFEYAKGVGYGIIASSGNSVDIADGQYRLLCTDIAGTEAGTGFLANLRGEITGVVDQTISDKDSMNLVTAYGISDLKSIIELLSNGKAVPYVGVYGVSVTSDIAEKGIPEGVYVKEVEADSPAMAAGIQSGDVITSVNGAKIQSVSGYTSSIMDKTVGQKIKLTGLRQGANGYVDINFTVVVGSKE